MVSCEDIMTTIDSLEILERHNERAMTDNERTLLGLISALNSHHVLIAKALNEISTRLPGSITIKTTRQLSQMLMKG